MGRRRYGPCGDEACSHQRRPEYRSKRNNRKQARSIPNSFEEGTGLAASCRTQLDRAEQQVVRLMKGADGAPVETEFTGEE